MRLIAGHVICACGWHGVLKQKDPCPSCGRPAIDRMDEDRIEMLRTVDARPNAYIPRMMRKRLSAIGVLRASGPRIAPSDVRRKKPPSRDHAVTELGRAVLAAAAALRQKGEQRDADDDDGIEANTVDATGR